MLVFIIMLPYHIRTEDEKYMRRQAALGRLLSYPPSLLVKGIGEEEFREGTLLLFEGLQCHQLNKQVSQLTPNHTSLAAQTPPSRVWAPDSITSQPGHMGVKRQDRMMFSNVTSVYTNLCFLCVST